MQSPHMQVPIFAYGLYVCSADKKHFMDSRLHVLLRYIFGELKEMHF